MPRTKKHRAFRVNTQHPVFLFLREMGLEPTRPNGHKILSLACLPFQHSRATKGILPYCSTTCKNFFTEDLSRKIFSKIIIILLLPHAFSWHCFFSEHSFSSPRCPEKLCPFPPSFPHRKLYSLPPVLFASSLFYSSSFLFLL